ncbi:MAG: hypothetical protein ACREA0_31865, partial [bacterium]
MRKCMRKRLSVSIVTVIAGLVFWGAIARAQTAPPANRDLTGIWALQQAASPSWAPNTNRAFSSEMPMQQWAQEHCRTVGCGRGVNSSGVPGGDAYLQGEDPTITRCAPHGFPRVLLSGGLMEILQVPSRVFMRFNNYNELREIWTDGRRHPDSPNRPWMGHAIGRWDGDTLVTDTIDFYGDPKIKWLDEAGHPHSEELHVTERIRRINRDTLQNEITFEDPKTFTAPIRGRVTFELRPDAEIVEYMWNCEDRIFADSPDDAWPFFTGEYPKPQYP